MYPVEIINKIKMQDAEAFRELVNMYGKRMYLRLYEKSGNREIALEAVKEVLQESQEVSSKKVDEGLTALKVKKTKNIKFLGCFVRTILA